MEAKKTKFKPCYETDFAPGKIHHTILFFPFRVKEEGGCLLEFLVKIQQGKWEPIMGSTLSIGICKS